jgi:lipid-A-disaccharide synthase
MKYYIIAGEASGDLHGSRLIKAIQKNDAHAIVRAWGGDLMQAEGATIVQHYRDLAFMGFVEVALHIRTIFKNLQLCKQDMLAFQPDLVVFIDYPGFNLPIAKFAKRAGFKTVYYISPQVWAWKEKRVKKIKQCIDRMLVILPFEKRFYEQWNYEVEYVGHPLIETIDLYRASEESKNFIIDFKKNHPNPVVAILPGSRKQEIRKKLPVMLNATKNLQGIECVVAQAPGIDDRFIHELVKNHSNISIWKNTNCFRLQMLRWLHRELPHLKQHSLTSRKWFATKLPGCPMQLQNILSRSPLFLWSISFKTKQLSENLFKRSSLLKDWKRN